MGKVEPATIEQKLILEEFKKDNELSHDFYFTGGTALSLFYFQHRKSVDLDFFSPIEFDPQMLLVKLTGWQKKLNFKFIYTPKGIVHTFDLDFNNKTSVKIDFSFYPYKSLKPKVDFNGIPTDSLFDIGVNKLLTIEQRAEVKDFVDLYFIMKDFNFWDLFPGIEVKFNLELEKLVLASDMLKVEEFDYLPQMIKPLDLDTLKDFFRRQAKSLGLTTVKK